MTDAGATAFAAFLRPVILQACGAPCVPPLAVTTLLQPTVRAHRATIAQRMRDLGSPDIGPATPIPDDAPPSTEGDAPAADG